MRGRELFQRFSGPIVLVAAVLRALPLGVRHALLRSVRGWRGLTGITLRYCLLRALGVTTAPNVSIREDVYLLGVEGLAIGRNVSIHPMSYIDASGGVSIGNDVSIAHAVTVMSTSHEHLATDAAIKDQGSISRHTTVEDNCWIGAQAVILAGVRIGSGSVVAANSVVTRDVPDNAIVAGSPAKVVRDRG